MCVALPAADPDGTSAADHAVALTGPARPDGEPIAGVVEVFLPYAITGVGNVAKDDQERVTPYDPPSPDGCTRNRWSCRRRARHRRLTRRLPRRIARR